MAATISASVGQGGVNNGADVITVKQLLNGVDPMQGGADPKLDEDGRIAPRTIEAIRAFQQRQFGWADGRVDTDNVTIAKLNELSGTPSPEDDSTAKLDEPSATPDPVDDPTRCTCRLPPGTRPLGAPPKPPLELAALDAPVAMSWARAAVQTLESAINQLLGADGDRAPDTPEIARASTHFHIDLIPNNFARQVLLDRARLNYLEIIKVLSDTDHYFGAGDNHDPAAYAYTHVGWYWVDSKNYKVCFNDTYAGCGPKCRCAMVLHECGHYVAKAVHYAREGPTLAGTADVPAPDGSGHGATHPRDYAHLFPTEALHNACTYAAFAFHCFDGHDGRPGVDHINE